VPIYEYVCKNCGAKIEVLQRFSDPPLTKCEKCGGELEKIISQCTFHLKGSGWYATDYAKKDTGGEKAKRRKKDKQQEKKD